MRRRLDANAPGLPEIHGGPISSRQRWFGSSVALEDPAAEFAACREDSAEEPGVDQLLEFERAGRVRLVVHDAVSRSGFGRGSCEARGSVDGFGEGLFSVDVLVRSDGFEYRDFAQLVRIPADLSPSRHPDATVTGAAR
jgi:hypothetical protein